ncbi:glycosyltransferase family 4 protein [Nocardia terpenica]|nr:glycosyltransferase family 4 protein [Nocardia terpenica]MBF6060380.1 glycosyltransferase family 4 protein [Nocardia terpenica]MBF6103640.1 glycosyltransferase family 4 protein [Nocardia terpenica]MBF6111986.1 glycosyltransferase family 4 protein [Nocardia terpenica]MBF6117861.1 glycosyltransferase family 4 protein [Nocardia terpenica]MBF6155413.1 glycosyltransferase family 4 protein [Nocardia terpenica]
MSSTLPGADALIYKIADTGAPLHIVMIAPPYFEVPPAGYGGVEAVVAQLADALVARGHRVTLLGAGRPGTTARFIPVWDTILSDRLGDPFPEVLNALKVRQIVAELARTDHIDVIHDHTFAGPLNAPLYHDLGIATVVTVHGPVDGEAQEYYRTLADTTHLVAISDRQRSLAPDLNWVGRVHNAIRASEWPFRVKKQDFALFLGRYVSYKGPDLALRAAQAAGIPLVLAAKMNEPPEKAYFTKSVRPLLSPRDVVFGEADAVAKKLLLSSARCLLFPIRWEEPFGIVMIEAMACGTPVVALRGGAVDEVVEDGVTGIICDEPSDLPAAIAEAHRIDPAACRRRVIDRFSVDHLGAGYESAYYTALAAHHSRSLPDRPLSLAGQAAYDLGVLASEE